MIALKYDKVDLDKSSDVFSGKLVNYRISDHPKELISHEIDITGSFSKLIKIIYK